MSPATTRATPPNLRPHLIRSAVFLAPVVASLLIWLLGTGSSILSGLGAVGGGGGRALDLGPSVNSGLMVIGLGGIVVFGLVWAVSLFVPVREVIAEGGLLVADGAGSSEAVYGLLRARLERQCPPFTVRPGSLEGHPTLELRGDVASGLVLVRTVGPDLRIGWTMWSSRSTSTLVLETFPGRRGHDGAVLDADLCSTMLEWLHDAVEYAAEHTGRTGAGEERR